MPLYLELLHNDPSMLGYGPWHIKENISGYIIGEIGFKGKPRGLEKTVDIGYQIDKQYRNLGYATESVFLLCKWLTTTSALMVSGWCDRENYISQKVLANNGFKLRLKDGDFLLYQKKL